ncbi:MAG: GAF domain-containing sensor histidine kinase [Chloroflexi bacterium]|nr:GAF domain-containing sensor histidine kinase [Chloroflexota bacterium]
MQLLRRREQDRTALQVAQADLTRQYAQLLAAHEQLEIIHDVTLLLQGASDIQSAQQRVLRAVTGELGFSQAIIGLVNPATQSLANWQVDPLPDNFEASNLNPLPLTPEHGLMAQALLDGRARWWVHGETLTADETLNAWLSQSAWLIMPLVLPEQPVGLLLVAVEGGPGSLSEDQLVVLTAMASQAATALGTIDRAQRLAAEQERNRIARDIHDTVAQSLFGMVFTLDACIKMLPQHSETVQQELVELRHLADQVRHEVRRYILDTWPSELTQEGFIADLDKYVAHFAPAHAFQIDFTINGDFDRLPSVIRRSLYRVAQEALANAARHAGMDSARLTMHVEADEVYLSISDRGKGFEPKLALAREVNRERFGLRGIRERIHALGGTCDILSQVGQGTQILVQVPIKRRHERG